MFCVVTMFLAEVIQKETFSLRKIIIFGSKGKIGVSATSR